MEKTARVTKISIPGGIDAAFKEINKELRLWRSVQEFMLWATRSKIVEIKTAKRKDLVMEAMQV